MAKQSYTCVLASDFNLQNFAGYLTNDPEFPAIEAITTPYGQVASILMDNDAPCWQNEPDLALVWTRPESVIPEFNTLLKYQQIRLSEILQQVDEYCALLISMSSRVKFTLVPSWVLPSYRSVFGVLDMKTGIGLTNTLMRMNLRLADNLEKTANIHLLNSERWIGPAGSQAFSPQLWYLGKIIFDNQVFKASGMSKPRWADCSDLPASSSL